MVHRLLHLIHDVIHHAGTIAAAILERKDERGKKQGKLETKNPINLILFSEKAPFSAKEITDLLLRLSNE